MTTFFIVPEGGIVEEALGGEEPIVGGVHKLQGHRSTIKRYSITHLQREREREREGCLVVSKECEGEPVDDDEAGCEGEDGWDEDAVKVVLCDSVENRVTCERKKF